MSDDSNPNPNNAAPSIDAQIANLLATLQKAAPPAAPAPAAAAAPAIDYSELARAIVQAQQAAAPKPVAAMSGPPSPSLIPTEHGLRNPFTEEYVRSRPSPRQVRKDIEALVQIGKEMSHAPSRPSLPGRKEKP